MKPLFLLHPLLCLTAVVWLAAVAPLYASARPGPARIVVLPCYQAENTNPDSRIADHYRRTLGAINNQLAAHGFEVINPAAYTALQEEYNRLARRAGSDSVLVSRSLCKRFQTDAAYLAWLDVRTSRLADGRCRAVITLEGVGYDAAGRDLGAGLNRTVQRTEQDCAGAVLRAETAVGDLIGLALTGTAPGDEAPEPAPALPEKPDREPLQTLAAAAQQLIHNLALACTEGNSFALTIDPAAPEGAGQPALRLGRELDPLLAAAVDRDPDLPVSLTPRLHYTLQPGYGLVGREIQLTARLRDQAGTIRATATAMLGADRVAPELLEPWVHRQTRICSSYQPAGPDAPAAASREARLLLARLGSSLGKIGLTAADCRNREGGSAEDGFTLISGLEITEEQSGRGFTLVRAAVQVRILNPAGEQVDVFEREQTQPYHNRSYRGKTVRQAIQKAMDSGLDRVLAKALLVERP